MKKTTPTHIYYSWGADWGINGYGRMERGRDICGLLSYAFYVEWTDLDENDYDDGGDDGSDGSDGASNIIRE